MIKGELTVYKDSSEPTYKWTASFKTNDMGTFYSYGKDRHKALSKLGQTIESLHKSKN